MSSLCHRVIAFHSAPESHQPVVLPAYPADPVSKKDAQRIATDLTQKQGYVNAIVVEEIMVVNAPDAVAQSRFAR